MGDLTIVRSVADLRTQITAWRKQGKTIAFVPTMGALHEGHLSLIKLGHERADKVCVSLFVNPKQFGPNEDFEVYPRDEQADIGQLEGVGTNLLYAPDVTEIYPDGHTTSLTVGPIADILEGECRPGFFTGVATVVSKLLLQVLPDIAIFGEKDFQQLQVIRKVVKDMDIPVDIVGGPTVRERDGLALSSRNAYLSDEERAVASKLHHTLQGIAKAVTENQNIDTLLSVAVEELKASGFGDVDYLAVRDATTLQAVTDLNKPNRVLVAATLGKTRLIDNIAI
ncbi:MAG: pantoate--beta-alanine ligase [Sneathiella sp.]|nr:pantoate--beta-alanine ligase [Sneathiella sp.]